MKKVFVFANQKGGCSKTSSTHSTAFGLARRGYKVLLIDMDAQCDLTDCCNIDSETVDITLYDVFNGNASIEDAVIHVEENVDIVPGDLELTEADAKYNTIGSEHILRKALEKVADKYDFCVIDTEPRLGILVGNALTAANGVIIPITTSRFSIKGMRQLGRYIRKVQEYTNRSLKVEGLLITRYVGRHTINRILESDIHAVAERLDTKVFESTIRQSISMDESQVMQTDIFNMNNSDIAEDYNNFIDELLKGV